MAPDMIFYQLFDSESSTYTYLLGDSQTGEAVIIDPVEGQFQRDIKLIQELGLKLKYILETHVHADHVTGANLLREATGAKTCVSYNSGVLCADINLRDQQDLTFGRFTLRALETPGHTDSCMTYVCEGMAFTGDALLIRGTGRTDFQEGSSQKLYSSIRNQIFSLAPQTKVFPAHDYKGMTFSTVELEMKYNPRVGLNKTEQEFIQIMEQLNLPPPKKLKESLGANSKCGQREG